MGRNRWSDAPDWSDYNMESAGGGGMPGGTSAPPANDWSGWKPDVTGAPVSPPKPTPSGGSGGGSNTSAPKWTPSSGAARKAWESAGRPDAPQGADFETWLNEWFKNAVNAGSFTERGTSTSGTAYTESGYSAPGAPDSTGMRAYARAHGMSEDFDRWSESQLLQWESQRDAGCPPNTPYQAFDGSGCVEKPIDSNNRPGGDGGGGGGGGDKGGWSSWGKGPEGSPTAAAAPKKEKKFVAYEPSREKVYGGGHLGLTMTPGGGGISNAMLTSPQVVASNALQVAQSPLMPGSQTTSKAAVGGAGLWPSMLGGLG